MGIFGSLKKKAINEQKEQIKTHWKQNQKKKKAKKKKKEKTKAKKTKANEGK